MLRKVYCLHIVRAKIKFKYKENLSIKMSAIKKTWTYDEVQALIHAVRKNPSLYDRRDPDYNQTRTKEVKQIKTFIDLPFF